MSEAQKTFRKIVKGAGIIFIGLTFSKLFSYIYKFVIGRMLGVEIFGVLAFALMLLGFACTISGLAIKEGTLRYVSFFKGKRKWDKIKGTVVSSFQIVVPISVLMFVALFFMSNYISQLFLQPDLALLLKLLSFSLPLIIITEILSSITLGLQNVKYYVLFPLFLNNFLKLVLTIILIVFGLRLVALGAGYTISFLIVTIAFGYLTFKKIHKIWIKYKPRYNRMELIKFSWPLLPYTIIWSVMGWIDTFMISYFYKDFSLVGSYNAALTIATILMIVPMIFMTIFSPIITELYARHKKKNIKLLNRQINKLIFLANFPLLLIFTVFPVVIIRMLFGQDFLTGANSLIVLGIGFFIFGIANSSIVLLKTIKKTKINLINSIITIVINITLNYFLIQAYGIIGAAIATAISYIIYSLLDIIQAHHYMKMQPISKPTIKAIFAGVIPFIALIYLKMLYTFNSILLVITIGIVFLATYLTMLLLLKFFEEDDIQLIRAIFQKVKLSKSKRT
ncbi:hypothetical protein DRJ17_02505 [Candidatus Woesearchaeota archaeon]|nr:MAG: hypothetical protein DRJ17_02505 [Candidatus Woesearchaeota archaeon]